MVTMTPLEAIEVTRALFVDAMTKAPALEPDTIGRRGSMILRWPRGSVGWWNERVQACDDVRATYEEEAQDVADAHAVPNRAWELST